MVFIEIPLLASDGLLIFYGSLGLLLVYWVFKFLFSVITGG